MENSGSETAVPNNDASTSLTVFAGSGAATATTHLSLDNAHRDEVWFGQRIQEANVQTPDDAQTHLTQWQFSETEKHPAAASVDFLNRVNDIAQSENLTAAGSLEGQSSTCYAPSGAFLARSFVDPLSRLLPAHNEMPGSSSLQSLSVDLISALGRLSALDVSDFGLEDIVHRPVLDAVHLDALNVWTDVYRQNAPSIDPIVEATLRALNHAPPPPPRRLALVHGLGPSGGVLVGKDMRFLGLVNWRFSHIGHPLEDLAWALRHSVRLGGPSAHGHITMVEAFALWQADSQYAVEPESMAWWQVFSALKAIALAHWQLKFGAKNQSGTSPAQAVWALHTLNEERRFLAKNLNELLSSR